MNAGPDDLNEKYGPHRTQMLPTGYNSPRRRPRLAGLAAVAVIALAGGGGIAYVATHSGTPVRTVASSGSAQSPAPSPSPSKPSEHEHGQGGFGFGRFGGIGGLGMAGHGGVVHGQFTVPKSGGGYQTIDVQSGTVTAVSSSSITVKSADGYSQTYAVSSSTEVNAQAAGIGTVKVGHTVGVMATASGKTATAASIIDFTSIRSSRGSFGFPAGPPDSGQS
jgi:hypothetical protein